MPKPGSSLQGPIAGGTFEAACLQLSSILKRLGMFILLHSNVFIAVVVFWTRNIEAWLNSVPAAVVDTVRHHAKAWPPFCCGFLTECFSLPQSNVQQWVQAYIWMMLMTQKSAVMWRYRSSIVYLTWPFPSTGDAETCITHLPRMDCSSLLNLVVLMWTFWH